MTQLTDVMERAREVAKAIDDPWGAPVANDVREILVRAIAQALRLERDSAFEKAAMVAKKHLRNTAMLASNPPQSSAAWDIAVEIRAMKGKA